MDDGDDLSALSAALEDAPAPQMEVEEPPQQADEAVGSGDEDVTGEAVIDAPSAAEVTAALEALSNGDNGGDAIGTAAPAKPRPRPRHRMLPSQKIMQMTRLMSPPSWKR